MVWSLQCRFSSGVYGGCTSLLLVTTCLAGEGNTLSLVPLGGRGNGFWMFVGVYKPVGLNQALSGRV